MKHTAYYWCYARLGKWLLGLLWLLTSTAVWAQQKVQVVTRTLEQQWTCPPNVLVRIRAEKATLRVQGWDKPQVQVVLRLSARHPDRSVAEQDLKAAGYRLERNGNALDLLNFFTLPAGVATVRSDLRAEYTVWMPTSNALQAVNTYGRTELVDLQGKQRLEQDFGQITLRNLRGTLNLVARYTDLTASNVEANLTCDANKSAVQLLGLGGTCLVRNRYGSVQVQPEASLRQLTVEADRTAVTISVLQPLQFAYQLSVLQGSLDVPDGNGMVRRTASGRTTLGTKTTPTDRPLIRVSTSYAPLTVQSQALVQRP